MSDNKKPRVAFFGLGIMGIGMARRLLGAGYELTVYNRNASKAQPLAAEGAKIAASPRDAAKGAQVLIAMLADDDASRAIWLGENGALASAEKGAIAMDCSTLTVDWVRQLAGEAADSNEAAAALKASLLFLGFDVASAEVDEDKVARTIANRLALIAAKNWAEADRIRDELLAQGVQLKDGKDPATGERITTWEVKR